MNATVDASPSNWSACWACNAARMRRSAAAVLPSWMTQLKRLMAGEKVVSAERRRNRGNAMDGTGRLSSPSSRPSLQRRLALVVLEEVSAGCELLMRLGLPHRVPAR